MHLSYLSFSRSRQRDEVRQSGALALHDGRRAEARGRARQERGGARCRHRGRARSHRREPEAARGEQCLANSRQEFSARNGLTVSRWE